MADDHEIFRDGFQLIISRAENIELVGQAANGVELLEMVESFSTRCCCD
jgi:DNA-binding NarL/FixJ family response regulator